MQSSVTSLRSIKPQSSPRRCTQFRVVAHQSGSDVETINRRAALGLLLGVAGVGVSIASPAPALALGKDVKKAAEEAAARKQKLKEATDKIKANKGSSGTAAVFASSGLSEDSRASDFRGAP